MWKAVVMAYSKVLLRCIPGRTEETYQTLESIAYVWADIWNTNASHSVM